MYPGCLREDGQLMSFTRKDDLNQHLQLHVHERRLFPCPVSWCHRVGENGLPTQRKLLEHVRETHRSRDYGYAGDSGGGYESSNFDYGRASRSSSAQRIERHPSNFDGRTTGLPQVPEPAKPYSAAKTQENVEPRNKKESVHVDERPTNAAALSGGQANLATGDVFSNSGERQDIQLQEDDDVRGGVSLYKLKITAPTDKVGLPLRERASGSLSPHRDTTWHKELFGSNTYQEPGHQDTEQAIFSRALMQYDQDVANLVSRTLSHHELAAILVDAIQDSEFGLDGCYGMVQCSIENLGKDLLIETENALVASAAVNMQKQTFSRGAARKMLLQADAQRLEISTLEAGCEQSSTILEGLDQKDEPAEQLATELAEAITTIWNSKSFLLCKKSLLNMVHDQYEKRMMSALSCDLTDMHGKNITSPTKLIREMSWVPVHLFGFPDDRSLTVVDQAKGYVEEIMDESWNWSPLQPRRHRLKAGFCRVTWKSVSTCCTRYF
jgi:hypothetical protein